MFCNIRRQLYKAFYLLLTNSFCHFMEFLDVFGKSANDFFIPGYYTQNRRPHKSLFYPFILYALCLAWQ